MENQKKNLVQELVNQIQSKATEVAWEKILKDFQSIMYDLDIPAEKIDYLKLDWFKNMLTEIKTNFSKYYNEEIKIWADKLNKE